MGYSARIHPNVTHSRSGRGPLAGVKIWVTRGKKCSICTEENFLGPWDARAVWARCAGHNRRLNALLQSRRPPATHEEPLIVCPWHAKHHPFKGELTMLDASTDKGALTVAQPKKDHR